jgi:hypothetical protein
VEDEVIVLLSRIYHAGEDFLTAEGAETAEFFFRFLCELRGLCGKRFGCGRGPRYEKNRDRHVACPCF